MLAAIISFILICVNFLLKRICGEEEYELDGGRKAATMAKVSQISDKIDYFIALWWRCVLWIATFVIAALAITLLLSLIGIASNWAWVLSTELWRIGSLSHLMGEYGSTNVIVVMALAFVLLVALFGLAVWLIARLRRGTNKRA